MDPELCREGVGTLVWSDLCFRSLSRCELKVEEGRK